jgi:hypothetical protein
VARTIGCRRCGTPLLRDCVTDGQYTNFAVSYSGAVPEKPVLLKTQTRYIDDQGWSLLTAFRDPLPHLAAHHVPEAGPTTKHADPWVTLSREDVICGEWAGPTGALPVRRLVITSEAKTRPQAEGP